MICGHRCCFSYRARSYSMKSRPALLLASSGRWVSSMSAEEGERKKAPHCCLRYFYPFRVDVSKVKPPLAKKMYRVTSLFPIDNPLTGTRYHGFINQCQNSWRLCTRTNGSPRESTHFFPTRDDLRR